jgi:hypothetical protein
MHRGVGRTPDSVKVSQRVVLECLRKVDGRRRLASDGPVDWEDPGDFGHRRRYTRREVQLPARVRAGGRELAATTENISPGGAFLRVQLPEDTVDLFASIELPHGRGLHVRAKVCWRRANPPGVGVEFATFLDDSEAFNRSA